jgi:hypothetical protein
VRTRWRTATGQSGSGRAVPVVLPDGTASPDTGTFWFFDPANTEMVVKVLDGCALGGHFWVFAGGLTNVRVTTTVRDTVKGVEKTYVNPQGRAFLPLQDTSAFDCP